MELRKWTLLIPKNRFTHLRASFYYNILAGVAISKLSSEYSYYGYRWPCITNCAIKAKCIACYLILFKYRNLQTYKIESGTKLNAGCKCTSTCNLNLQSIWKIFAWPNLDQSISYHSVSRWEEFSMLVGDKMRNKLSKLINYEFYYKYLNIYYTVCTWKSTRWQLN